MASRGGKRRRQSAPGSGRPHRSPGPGRPGPRAPSRGRRAGPPSASLWLEASLERVRDRTGLPAWGLVLGAAFWGLSLLLWATGAVAGSFAVFLGTVLSAAIGTGYLAAAAAKAKQPLRGARAVLVVVLMASVPVVFDPHTGDVFNVPKYTVVVVGALALVGLWVVSIVEQRAVPTWRNGLQWVVAALVAWTAVSAFTGMDVHVALLGNYGSYDGLFLAACLGVVAMTAAEALDVDDVRRALGAFAFGGGTIVVIYGLIQLHDTEVGGADGTSSSGSWAGPSRSPSSPRSATPTTSGATWPWSSRPSWYSGCAPGAGPGERLRPCWPWPFSPSWSGLRRGGAWLAAIAGLVVLAAALAPELRRRAIASISAAVGVVGVTAVGMALDGKHFLSEPLSALFQSGGNTSVEQRLEIWKVALRMALNHPVTGIGPDNFALIFPRYQTASWVAGLGATYLVNGAHDIFMNVLADQGFVGLALFLAFLVVIGLRSVGAWRRLRRVERDESTNPELKHRAQVHRSYVGVVSAAIVAYLVQAIFNVQQVGLSFLFWAMAGMSAALALAAGVPVTLRLGVLLSDGLGAGQMGAGQMRTGGYTGGTSASHPDRGARRPNPMGPRRRPAGRDQVPWATVITAAGVTAAVVLLALGADGPYRADHDYWAASTSVGASTAPTRAAPAPTAVGAVYFADIQHALSLNPWEPTYPTAEATVLVSAAGHAPSAADTSSELLRARRLLAQAVADSPLNGTYSAAEAQVDLDLATIPSTGPRTDLSAAVTLARRAIVDNPRDADYRLILSRALAAQRKAAAVKS